MFLFTALYRFNTLGGTLGGFDDDHFVNLARANQLLLGEWPLRDYPDASLQSAWPPLTYLASAGAQVVFGHSLLAEALLTTGMVGLGAVLTMVAAANVTGSRWLGVFAAALSVMPSIKLYGYARPALFAGGLLLIFRYLDRPSARRVVALAAMLALAFLVRHDYAVYLVAGIVAASLARAWRAPRDATLPLLACGALTVALLLPAVFSVHRLVGIEGYLAAARALSEDEFNRTSMRWPVIDAADLWTTPNAVASMYYLFLALPVIAAAVALWRAWRGVAPPGELEKVLAVSAAGFLANRFLLRGNVEARLADTAVFIAIAGVWLSKVAWERGAARASQSSGITWAVRWATLVVAGLSVVALGAIGSVSDELGTAQFKSGPLKTAKKTVAVWSELRQTPPVAWTPDGLDGSMLAAAYLNTCTAASDRILVATYAPEIGPFARRAFAAGHVDWVAGLYATPAEQEAAVARAGRQSIPIVLTEPADVHAEEFAKEFPIVETFLREQYREAGAITSQGDPFLRVLVRRDLEPKGTFGQTQLPCFR